MIISQPASRRTAALMLQWTAAAAFLAAGEAKLAAAPSEVQLFAQIGLGQWLRILTGLVQITGAVALVYPRLVALGGLWVGLTMVCAVAANVFVVHANPALALVLAFVSALIVYVHRDELAATVKTLRRGRERHHR